MFFDFQEILECDVCDEGVLLYDRNATLEDYVKTHFFQSVGLDSIEEKVVNAYLVFRCDSCSSTKKYTYKEVESKVRKELTDKVKYFLKGEAFKEAIPNFGKNRYFIYCGKCPGFDGKGACPSIIYDTCKLRRLPNGL